MLYAIFTILSMMALPSYQLPENLVIAHRGVPYFAPEETAPSFELARDLGADYLEADLQRTSDGVIITLHDNDLRRTTNVMLVFPDRAKEPVSSFTWAELQQLDAGSWFNKKFPERARPGYAGVKILSLHQLIDIAEAGDHNTGLYLETKNPEQFPGIEKELKTLLEQRGWYRAAFTDGRPKVILQTFSPKSLQLLHENFPDGPICWLLWKGEACLSEVDEGHLQECLDFAQMNGATIIGPSFRGDNTFYYNLMQDWIVEMAHDQGFLIHPYTFTTKNDIEKYAPQSDGQFTDRADLLLDHYQRARPEVELVLTENGY
jgi:glycerophosphoryl diester phosphodiesterase